MPECVGLVATRGAHAVAGLAGEVKADIATEWSAHRDNAETCRPFVAKRGGIVGEALLCSRPFGGPRVPADTIGLAHAATLSEVRGSGAGLALTVAVSAWAHEKGHTSITTGRRVVRRPASRFWPKRCFRPHDLRLQRAVS